MEIQKRASINMNKKLNRKREEELNAEMVRDWFDTVFNPLLERLKDECDLINIYNFTWRFKPCGFEFLREINIYLDQSGKRNLEQIVAVYPSMKKHIQAHDIKLKLLGEKCALLHIALTKKSQNLQLIYQCISSDESLKEPGLYRMFGSSNQEDHIDLIAEYIVNQKGELPYYHSISPLWNKYRNEFLAILEKEPLLSKKKALIETSDDFLLKTQELIRFLDDKRMDLSFRYKLALAKPTNNSANYL